MAIGEREDGKQNGHVTMRRTEGSLPGEPVRVSLWHCLPCKVRSGSAFSYTATFAGDAVTTEGEPAAWERVSEEGHRSRRFFRSRCGRTVWYEIDRRPGMISLPAGAFADPRFPTPEVEVFGERRQAWPAAARRIGPGAKARRSA